MPDTNTLPNRDEIPIEETWDTYSIFPSDQDWEAACVEIENQLPILAAFRGRLGERPETLLEWFKHSEKNLQMMMKVRNYSFSFIAVNTTDQGAIAHVAIAPRVCSENSIRLLLLRCPRS